MKATHKDTLSSACCESFTLHKLSPSTNLMWLKFFWLLKVLVAYKHKQEASLNHSRADQRSLARWCTLNCNLQLSVAFKAE